MVSLLYTELLKLKRSYMLLISIMGAAVAPFMVVVASYISIKTKHPTPTIVFEQLFNEVTLYTVVVIGVPLFGVITAYLFNREYAEDTLKNLLTIPVSRIKFLISKLIVLFLWIMLLILVAWGLTVIFGLLGQFKGLNSLLLINSLKRLLIGGAFLFILSTPAIFITIVLKSYVPTMVFTIVIVLLNLMTTNSKHRGLFPWQAAGDISRNTLLPTYPPEYSYIVIFATSFIGLIALITYFKRVDIH
ncbi:MULTISPECIES: ABC transporter permease [Bacillus]|uniref:ABC transporter permease n=1 Tax=Bacillus TaxID=1386 RepID=UPI00035D4A57|nr:MULTISPECIES: ABC transporter permease [Bacillus]AIK35631.1 ABC-2 transporter family protein [Bacillus pseudomycoides]AJI14789.1 ABC-2 transporter family protein [Bacillus pseudomycoides]MEB3057070.1 ABC transporter permease [Bacillus pseudomycoides]PEB38449.1 ABC transporter permease [Bacillus pseudomycoides]PEM31083.1 ABC transporter permease [Bacillus pseudomycoides]